MSLSHKLQEYRQSNKLSQEELANQLGVSRQSVSKWEQGLSFPETEKLITLSTMMGISIDSLLKDTPDEPVTPPPEPPAPTPEPAPELPWLKWLSAALVVLVAMVAIAHLYREPASPTPPDVPSESTTPVETTQPPETTVPPETTLPIETEPVPTEPKLRTPELLELQAWFFDFARDYRLDYMPRFTQENGAPTDSGEYLYWAYTINLDNWGDQKGTMPRSYVDETVWNYFHITPILHRSHHKQWGFDEETQVYTAWPDSLRPQPFYLLNCIEVDDRTFTVHATCYTCSYYVEPGPEDDLLRQHLLEGGNTDLTPISEITLTFTLSVAVFDEPLFFSYTETPIP